MLATLQQLIPYGTKHHLALTNGYHYSYGYGYGYSYSYRYGYGYGYGHGYGQAPLFHRPPPPLVVPPPCRATASCPLMYINLVEPPPLLAPSCSLAGCCVGALSLTSVGYYGNRLS